MIKLDSNLDRVERDIRYNGKTPVHRLQLHKFLPAPKGRNNRVGGRGERIE